MFPRDRTPTAAVRAAGGVVWRSGETGVEVCLVHRPRYDDWSLPKGKLEDGEHPLLAAVREVAEEADVQAVPQVRLAQTRYATRDGIDKVVDYWSMRAVATGGFQVDTEVDEIRWLSASDAVRLASYTHDVSVLRRFAALPPVTVVLGVVNGAWAEAGRGVHELAAVLALIRPQRLLSAGATREAPVLGRLADLIGLPVEVDDRFDRAGGDGPDRLTEIAAGGVATVVCPAGTAAGDAVARLAHHAVFADPSLSGAGASGAAGGWLLAFSGTRLVAVDALFGS